MAELLFSALGKKIFKRKRYSLAATWLDTSVLLPSGHSPSPPLFFPHPVYLIQAAVSGGCEDWPSGSQRRANLRPGGASHPPATVVTMSQCPLPAPVRAVGGVPPCKKKLVKP
eukprot:scaffold33392_cov101-Isochrysis_galbana.AAC.1